MNVRTSRNAQSATVDQADDAMDEVAQRIHNGVDAANEKIKEAAAEIEDHASDLESQLRDSGERLLESARKIGDVISRQTKEHPLAACGIAFVAGIAVARMLRR
jgi:ElaB/YqjD/DUF883 family membrane-anchored ribosome-binding protein